MVGGLQICQNKNKSVIKLMLSLIHTLKPCCLSLSIYQNIKFFFLMNLHILSIISF